LPWAFVVTVLEKSGNGDPWEWQTLGMLNRNRDHSKTVVGDVESGRVRNRDI